ncbi:hypothetical protein FJ365_02690 [Candidatus Dependentiae bacterium]|nr:hypothetical protein [Candidatus Dependentiae bacterium]
MKVLMNMRYLAFGLVLLLSAVGQAEASGFWGRVTAASNKRQEAREQKERNRRNKIAHLQQQIEVLAQEDNRTPAENEQLAQLQQKLGRKLSKQAGPRKKASWSHVRNAFRTSARGVRDNMRASVAAAQKNVLLRAQDAQDQVHNVVANASNQIAQAQEGVIIAAQEAQANALAVQDQAREMVQGTVAAGLEKIAAAQEHAVAVADAAQQQTLEQAVQATEELASVLPTATGDPIIVEQVSQMEPALVTGQEGARVVTHSEKKSVKSRAKKIASHRKAGKGKARKGVGHRKEKNKVKRRPHKHHKRKSAKNSND